MSTHFKWYDASEQNVVPWNAKYSFPSQANKAVKFTPRIPPKNGSAFLPGNVIRLEFPAQGYINPLNTTLEFDVTLMSYGTAGNEIVRFQNNIQSIFSRARLLYGATPLEDIPNYNVIVRALTEWTSTNQNSSIDQTSIAEGAGGFIFGVDGGGTVQGNVNVRQAYIQGIDKSTDSTPTALTKGAGEGVVPNTSVGNGLTSSAASGNVSTRRYQINLALGLFTQDKLLPVKFMASQLAIELTLDQPAACIFASQGTAGGASPSYGVTNINLIPEMLEFDSSYDAAFLEGLRQGGVPIKYSTWHFFQFNVGGMSTCNFQVAERNRSVKALFALQRRNPVDIETDSGSFFFDSSAYDSVKGNTMQNYQWRIGGRYFPSAPVQLSLVVGGYYFSKKNNFYRNKILGRFQMEVQKHSWNCKRL